MTYGGVLYMKDSSVVEIYNSEFVLSNSQSGGSIYSTSCFTPSSIMNTKFDSNFVNGYIHFFKYYSINYIYSLNSIVLSYFTKQTVQ